MRGVLVLLVLAAACSDSAAQTPPSTVQSAPVRSAEPATPPVVQAAAAVAPAAELDAGRGREIGLVFEAYLTPHQESDEEENTPSSTPKQFRATTPSQSRAEREAAGHRAHGQVRFTRDFSRAFVDVKIEGIDPATINMFHIHCGKPGILGPILADFSLATDLAADAADGRVTLELRNEHLVKTSEHGHGVLGAFTMGCVIPSPSLGTIKPSKVSTIAGMAQLALDRELYFNLHTTGQTYFGDIRGQLHPASP
jgi:hypothetical protein